MLHFLGCLSSVFVASRISDANKIVVLLGRASHKLLAKVTMFNEQAICLLALSVDMYIATSERKKRRCCEFISLPVGLLRDCGYSFGRRYQSKTY